MPKPFFFSVITERKDAFTLSPPAEAICSEFPHLFLRAFLSNLKHIVKGNDMATLSITLSEEQLSKILEAYKTIQDFLGSILSPNEIYHSQFLDGLRESDEDIRKGNMNEASSFDDFVS